MTPGGSSIMVLLLGSVIVSCTRGAHMAGSCNQIDLAPCGEATVSVFC
jgi:hypothetical protein